MISRVEPVLGDTIDMTGRPIQDVVKLPQELKALTWRDLSNDDLLAFLIYYQSPSVTLLDVSRQTCSEANLLPSKGLPKFFVSKHLTSLNVSGAIRCDNHALKIIATHKHLISLDMSCTGLLHLKKLAPLDGLVTLNVSENYLRDGDLKFIGRHLLSLRQLNISRNELTNGGVVKHFLSSEHAVYFQLDVSNQKIHYITPESLQRVQDRLIQARERKEDKPVIDFVELVDTPNAPIRLANVLTEYPHVRHLTLSEARSIDWSMLPEFKHLQFLTLINSIDTKNKTLAKTMESETCWSVGISNSIFIKIDAMKSVDVEIFDRETEKRCEEYATHIRKNKHLTVFNLSHSKITLDFLLTILKSPTIQKLSIIRCMIVRPSYVEDAKERMALERNNVNEIRAAIMTAVGSNTVLTHFEFRDNTTSTSFRGVLNTNIILSLNEIEFIEDQLANNLRRLEATRQVVPLIAATQLGGGPLRHSSIDIMPMIYKFMGVSEPVTKTQLTGLSKQIEPEVELGKRRRQEQQRPLPFMFNPSMEVTK